MRHSRSNHYSITLHDDAIDDLDGIYEVDEDAAADIETFIEEAKLNQGTLECLSINGYIKYGDNPFNVREWLEAKRERYNLWGVRLLWLESASDYRIVYAFHPLEYRYYILGVVAREFDYALNHPTSKRITAAYDALDIPRY